MTIFKCKMCGGDLEITPGSTVCECEYCGTQQTLPRLDDDRRANMYDRANHFRRANEFDKAMSMYETILEEDKTDSEAYWSLVLCRYGIEYVEDPATHKRVPTVNRAQFTSIFMDEDYKSALEYADAYQRTVYEQEAAAIDEIQKGILAISQNEKPFDVFICYKETGEDGRRTRDSVLANDLYHQLTQEGFKVFFARITLEDKLGQEYEPYIFAALNSAKVMVVLGTKPEHFNAVWVKNEWSRFLMLIKNGAKKTLIPAYRDMDPYDLPEEFSHLQAQDMNKLGFMQDLIRGIKKITEAEKEKPAVNQTTVINNAAAGQVEPLLKRAFMFLEDSDWSSANEYAEKVLDLDPECAKAYVVKLLADRQLNTQGELHFSKSRNADTLFTDPIANNQNYKKALRFADPDLKRALEKNAAENAEEYNRRRYEKAKAAMERAVTDQDYNNAARLFKLVLSYRDSSQLAEQCRESAKEYLYQQALAAMQSAVTEQDFNKAAKQFNKLRGHRDSAQLAEQCRQGSIEYLYQQALAAMQSAVSERDFKNVAAQFDDLHDYRDSVAYAQQCRDDAEYARTDALYNSYVERFNRARNENDYRSLKKDFESIIGHRDSEDYVNRCEEKAKEAALNKKYAEALELQKAKNSIDRQKEAQEQFEALGDFKDSKQKAEECRKRIAELEQEAENARLAAEKAAQKAKRIKIIAACTVAAIIAVVICVITLPPLIKYNKANKLLEQGSYDEAYDMFEELGDYKDSAVMLKEVDYQVALSHLNSKQYDQAINEFTELGDYSDSADMIMECKYQMALSHLNSKQYDQAINDFTELGYYSDSADMIKECKYQMALSLMEAKKYNESIDTFKDLSGYKDGYKDSDDKIKECKYQEGINLYNNKSYKDAIYKFKELGDYNDSQTYYKKALKELLSKTDVNGIVPFGNYDWIVIKKSSDKYTLFCKKNIEEKAYNFSYEDTTWEECTLRKWLNQDFYNEFTFDEQTLIAKTKCVNKDNSEYGTKGGNDT